MRHDQVRPSDWPIVCLDERGERVLVRSCSREDLCVFCRFVGLGSSHIHPAEDLPGFSQAVLSGEQWRAVCRFALGVGENPKAPSYLNSKQRVQYVALCRLLSGVVRCTMPAGQCAPGHLPLHAPPPELCVAHLEPTRPTPPCTVEDVRAVTDFLKYFEEPGFEPIQWFSTLSQSQSHGRHEALVNFALALRDSPLLLGREWLEQTPQFHTAHTLFWQQCRQNPSRLQEADAHAARWQISASHHERAFDEHKAEALFGNGYLIALLRRLRHLHDLPWLDKSEADADFVGENADTHDND